MGQATPSGNWQTTTKVTLDHDNAWQYAGLVVHVDDNNYTKLTFTRHTDGRRFVEFWSETNGARTAHGGNAFVATGAPDHDPPAADQQQWDADGCLLDGRDDLDQHGRHRPAEDRRQDRSPGRG